MHVDDINSALHVYNTLEDRRDVLRAEYDTKDKRLRDAQEQIEAFLLEEMKRLKLTAFEAPGEGVAKIVTKRRFGVADWGTFWTWVVENKCPNFLQKRLLDTEVQKYLDEQGTLPPAVNSEARLTIRVVQRPPREEK